VAAWLSVGGGGPANFVTCHGPQRDTAEVFRFAIGSITFSDQTQLEVPVEGVVVLVGPNNAGKSAALRDIAGHIQRAPGVPPQPVVVVGETLVTEGTEDEFEEWLRAHAFTIQRPDGRYYQRPRANIRWDVLRAEWGATPGQIVRSNLFNFMVLHAAADQR